MWLGLNPQSRLEFVYWTFAMFGLATSTVFLLGLLIVVVSMALAAEAAKFEAARSAEAASKREMKRGQGTWAKNVIRFSEESDKG